jgi:glycerol-3-phosphate dehydrogenase (NAD(P)+)
MIAANGFDVLGWEFNRQVVEDITHEHQNARYLPGVILSERLQATTELTAVFRTCGVIFVALPSAFVRGTLEAIGEQELGEGRLVVNMAKGIEKDTGLTSFEVISTLLPNSRQVMLSGPSIANEFARGLPTVVVVAGHSRNDLLEVSHILDNDYFRTRFSDDAVGVELGGILKNIYAIGLGLFDGKAITSINFRAVYLTIALEEISRFGVGMGAKIETFLYLSGIGDLLATSLSEHSHNRRMGELLARGLSRDQIRGEMGVLPEGYNTLSVVLYLAEKLHLSMPLAHGLWDVIQGKYGADRFINSFIKDFVE